MLTIHLLSASRKSPVGTPGSSAVERGFDLTIATRPGLLAYRAAVVWTENGWRAVHHAECHLVETRNGADIWAVGQSYFTSAPVVFFYALAAAGPDGVVWDNNGGWNHTI